jgi:prophage regulatory protein
MSQLPTPVNSLSVTPLLGKHELCERLTVSERTIENMVKAGSFPPPVRVGKHVFWSEAAVRKWQERLFAAQENWSPHPTAPSQRISRP